MASVLSSYGVTVDWGTLDVTGVALAGSGNEYGTVNGVPCGDLVEIGTFTNTPAVGSSSLSNFSVFASGHVGDGYGCPGSDGFWADESVAPAAGFAGTQIYVVVVNTSTVAAASQVGIFYVNDAFNPNWRFPSNDAAVISIDIEDLLNDPGTPSASLTSGAQIVYGCGPVYDAVDAVSFFQLQQTNSAPQVTTNSWSSPTNGKWETATNWSSGSAPSLSDSFDYITNAITKIVTIDATTTNTPSALIISNLYIAGTANSTNTLFLNNAGTNMPLQVLTNLTVDINGALVVNSSVVMVTNGLSARFIVGNTGGNASLIITNGGAVYSGSGNVGSGSFSDNNTVLVSGVGSVWSNSGTLSVGQDGVGNSLIITNGGAAYSASGNVGSGSSSGNNTVLVAGPGSVWSNSGTVSVGADGMGNNLVVSNGGAVVDENGYLGNNGSFSTDNTVLVSGAGSVWSNSGTVSVGQHGPANLMIITNGGAVYDSTAYVGHDSSSGNNTVLVTGTNSVWSTSTFLDVGDDDGGGDQLIIGNGGAVVATNVTVGVASLSSNTVLIASGGGLFVNGPLTVSLGSLILSNGTVTANQLVLTNGANSVFTFSAGTLISGGTFVTNNQLFAVGVGGAAATFQLNGGVHNFANNLEIRTNAALTGCGTINGNVLVDAGRHRAGQLREWERAQFFRRHGDQ